MSAYNLYLLDESRDPRVVARLSRVTALPESVIRRELRHPPFLILREHALSDAVAVRREFELMGLTLRLERVEAPTGDRSHPLAGEQAPDDGQEIVLEEGAGFKESVPGRDADTPSRWSRRLLGRFPWRRVLALLAALAALVVAALWLQRQAADPVALGVAARLESELPQLRARLEHLLRADLAGSRGADSLIILVDGLERAARPVWKQLSRRQQSEVEDLLARRATLVLRRAVTPPPPPPSWEPRDLMTLRADVGAAFWDRLAVEWNRRAAPASLGEQLALERLDDELQRVAASGDRASRAKLSQVEARDPQGRARLAALRLAGSLQQKGVAWSGEGEARQAWLDLPDSTALDVQENGGPTHEAHVIDGRLVFDTPTEGLQSVSVRLAALERQPVGLQRVLAFGLKLLSPEVYYATLPGSRLPRLDPTLAEAQWERAGDPALKAELERLGLKNGDLRRPVLALDSAGGARPDVADWLQAAADHYRRARAWPVMLELRTPEGRFHVSGCELWHLTRG